MPCQSFVHFVFQSLSKMSSIMFCPCYPCRNARKTCKQGIGWYIEFVDKHTFYFSNCVQLIELLAVSPEHQKSWPFDSIKLFSGDVFVEQPRISWFDRYLPQRTMRTPWSSQINVVWPWWSFLFFSSSTSISIPLFLFLVFVFLCVWLCVCPFKSIPALFLARLQCRSQWGHRCVSGGQRCGEPRPGPLEWDADIPPQAYCPLAPCGRGKALHIHMRAQS